MFNDKNLQKAVLAVMLGKKEIEEAKKPLHPNQQKIDVHEPEKDEITAKDFEMLRKGKRVKEDVELEEEVEELDELSKSTLSSYVKAAKKDQSQRNKAFKPSTFMDGVAARKTRNRLGGIYRAKEKMSEELEEEVEELDEMGPGKIPRIDKKVENEYGAKLMADFKAKGGEVKQVPSPALPKNRNRMVASGSLASKERRMTASGGRAYVRAEEVEQDEEQLDELKRSTLTSYIEKASKGPAYKTQQRLPGIKKAGEKIKQMKREEVEVDETITLHDSFEVPLKETYIFGDYLVAAKSIVGEEQAVELANYAFKEQDETLFVEAFMRSDIEDKVKAHQKAGHNVSMPKYSTKGGQPHAEYTVTDKDSGVRRKYIHHGTMRRVENMGTAGKRD